jgi:hypothetical protein
MAWPKGKPRNLMKADSAQRANRPKRTPLGIRNVLTAEQRPGFVRRWVNDVDDRLSRAKEAGYMPVMKPTETADPRAGADSQMGSLVAKSVGGGTRAVLMEIPEEFYRADQDEKQKAVNATESGLRRQPGIKGQQYGGTYGKVEITRKGETTTMHAEDSTD